MGQAIGDLLPLALGVAISPIPIIAVILMLLAPRAKGASLGFLVGWLAGIVVAIVVFLLLAGGVAGDSTADDPSPVASWIRIALGALFVLLAAMQWRSRPREGVEPSLPGWLQAIDKVTTVKAAGLGFLLAAVNPKNLAMAIAAGVAIGSAGLPGGEQAVAVVVYVVIAASTVAVPTIAYLAAPDRMQRPLDGLKSWLEANNSTVMAVLMLVIGVAVFGRGLGGLI
jgi:threonine/homoserine/homoserine lactone efflux protein